VLTGLPDHLLTDVLDDLDDLERLLP